MITKNASGSNLSTAYQTTLAGNGRTWRTRLYLNGTLLTGQIGIVKIYRGACGGEPFAGTVFVPYMDCEMKGVSANLEGETIEVQIGLLTNRANDTWEWTKAGTYVVSKPEVASDVTTFTAVGTLGTIGSGTATITATTYSGIISQIQTATGVTITTQGITVSGSPTDSFEDGITWRDALAEVAKALGGFLTETVNGTWVIAAYCSGSTVAIGADRSQEPPQYDEQSYTLASQTVESGVVEMAMGNPLLDPWDVLSVTDIAGVTHLVPCLQITHELHGGLSTTVDASVDTETQALANVQGPATKNMQYFWVDADGAHVTTIPKNKFLENPSGGNVLIDSNSIDFLNGTTALAEFGATGARIGLINDNDIILQDDAVVFRFAGEPVFSVSSHSLSGDRYGILDFGDGFRFRRWYNYLAIEADSSPNVTFYDNRSEFGKQINANAGIFASDDIELYKDSGTALVRVSNYDYEGTLQVTSAGRFGLYDVNNAKWVIYNNASGQTYIPDAPRIAGHSSVIGTVLTANDTISNLASNTDIARNTSAKISLGAGSWVVTGTARYTSNATGRRGINLYVGTSGYAATWVTIPAASGTTTKVQTTLATAQDEDFVVYMGLQQNSGSALNVDWYLRAIRVA